MNNSMGVFWDISQWRKGAGGSFPPDPSIDAETYEGMILELLDYLYESNKVSYEPDVDDSENYERLLVHPHIAGGRALRIRIGSELSEEALDCFREVSRTSMSAFDGFTDGTGMFTNPEFSHPSWSPLSRLPRCAAWNSAAFTGGKRVALRKRLKPVARDSAL